jgi:hypothetical protein
MRAEGDRQSEDYQQPQQHRHQVIVATETTMTELKLYEGQSPIRVTASTLFNVIKAIIAAGKEAEFLPESEKAKVAVEAGPEVVNFVKKYLHENQLHKNNAAISHIVAPMAGAPSCFPPR